MELHHYEPPKNLPGTPKCSCGWVGFPVDDLPMGLTFFAEHMGGILQRDDPATAFLACFRVIYNAMFIGLEYPVEEYVKECAKLVDRYETLARSLAPGRDD